MQKKTGYLILNLLGAHRLVATTLSSARQLHQSRTLVHGSIVDLFAAENSSSRFPLSKDGGGVAPKVLTVGDAASAVRVLLLALVLRRYCSSASDGLDEGINSQDTAPLLEHTALVLVRVSRRS